MNKVSIVGSGAWGTALALHAARAGHQVALIARDRAAASAIEISKASKHLPSYRIPNSLEIRDDIPGDPGLLLWATPTQHLRSSLMRLQPGTGAIVVCTKGLEEGTCFLPLEVVGAVCPGLSMAILTGPNFAAEVAQGLPAAAIVSSFDAVFREQVRVTLGTSIFRLYGNDDPVGAQLGGAAKNVIAIAAGAVIGAGLGENARAALVTRGLSEVCSLARGMGGRAETVMGLSGLGDLLLTCTGRSSRNFSLGYALGQGESLAEIFASRSGVTEGVQSACALVARAGSAEMPICRAVADLLAGVKTLDQAIIELLSRPQRDE